MSLTLDYQHLLDYTQWERDDWRRFFQEHGEPPLQLSAGPHGDGRFVSVGDLIAHIFWAEQRYVERLTGRPLTEVSAIPRDPATLFDFGVQSRKQLAEFLSSLPAAKWDQPVPMKILTHEISPTPRKIVTHVLMHEIRHWAQIGTLLRLNGYKVQFHDFLFSPVL